MVDVSQEDLEMDEFTKDEQVMAEVIKVQDKLDELADRLEQITKSLP